MVHDCWKVSIIKTNDTYYISCSSSTHGRSRQLFGSVIATERFDTMDQALSRTHTLYEQLSAQFPGHVLILRSIPRTDRPHLHMAHDQPIPDYTYTPEQVRIFPPGESQAEIMAPGKVTGMVKGQDLF